MEAVKHNHSTPQKMYYNETSNGNSIHDVKIKMMSQLWILVSDLVTKMTVLGYFPPHH